MGSQFGSQTSSMQLSTGPVTPNGQLHVDGERHRLAGIERDPVVHADRPGPPACVQTHSGCGRVIDKRRARRQRVELPKRAGPDAGTVIGDRDGESADAALDALRRSGLHLLQIGRHRCRSGTSSTIGGSSTPRLLLDHSAAAAPSPAQSWKIAMSPILVASLRVSWSGDDIVVGVDIDVGIENTGLPRAGRRGGAAGRSGRACVAASGSSSENANTGVPCAPVT